MPPKSLQGKASSSARSQRSAVSDWAAVEVWLEFDGAAAESFHCPSDVPQQDASFSRELWFAGQDHATVAICIFIPESFSYAGFDAVEVVLNVDQRTNMCTRFFWRIPHLSLPRGKVYKISQVLSEHSAGHKDLYAITLAMQKPAPGAKPLSTWPAFGRLTLRLRRVVLNSRPGQNHFAFESRCSQDNWKWKSNAHQSKLSILDEVPSRPDSGLSVPIRADTFADFHLHFGFKEEIESVEQLKAVSIGRQRTQRIDFPPVPRSKRFLSGSTLAKNGHHAFQPSPASPPLLPPPRLSPPPAVSRRAVNKLLEGLPARPKAVATKNVAKSSSHQASPISIVPPLKKQPLTETLSSFTGNNLIQNSAGGSSPLRRRAEPPASRSTADQPDQAPKSSTLGIINSSKPIPRGSTRQTASELFDRPAKIKQETPKVANTPIPNESAGSVPLYHRPERSVTMPAAMSTSDRKVRELRLRLADIQHKKREIELERQELALAQTQAEIEAAITSLENEPGGGPGYGEERAPKRVKTENGDGKLVIVLD